MKQKATIIPTVIIILLVLIGCSAENESIDFNDEIENISELVEKNIIDGMSIETRKKIYFDICNNEQEARLEAQRQYPVDYTKPGFKKENVELYTERWNKFLEYAKQEIIKHYEITEDVYYNIMSEGFNENWRKPIFKNE